MKRICGTFVARLITVWLPKTITGRLR